MSIDQFQLNEIPPDADALRQRAREFLATALDGTPRTARARSWSGYDADFSRRLGKEGLIGLALPQVYGGAGRSTFSRFVVVEELLAAGAPVAAHWIAERQSAPLLLRFGTEEQKKAHLPPICRGERYFCIGMSEPDSGSDLASIRTRAVRTDGGWRLEGRKLWTTNAHRSHYMILLARTDDGGERHEGLSQFIVDLSLPGVDVRPVRDLTGEAHFNEVVLDRVNVSESDLVGVEGQGWAQVTAELAFERSGPERFLSSIAAIDAMTDTARATHNPVQVAAIGRHAARLAALRCMSVSVTSQIEANANPVWAAACVKDYGVSFEQEVLETAATTFDFTRREQTPPDDAETIAYLTQTAPSFSLRGGTREILRGVIARGLGLR